MATVEELATDYIAKKDAFVSAFAKYTEALQAIDPNAADAKQQLENATKLRDQANLLKPAMLEAYQKASDAATAANQLGVAKQLNTDAQTVVSLISAAQTTRQELENKITAAQTSKPAEPPVAAPTPTAAGATGATGSTTPGPANDDKTVVKDPGKNQGQPGMPGPPPTSPSAASTTASTPTPNPNTTPSGSSPSAPGAAPTDPNSKTTAPGVRINNILGDYPSHTYQITLYMISPEAYDQFIASGRKTINTSIAGGTYIICQSGGVNNFQEQRGAGFNLDYYIDNLQITNYTNAKESETATNTTEISFNIIEPYGFSFLSNLTRASNALIQASPKAQGLKNPSRQFFILGIRFLGYDKDGAPLKSPIAEKFIDISLYKVNFKLDGKATTYNCEAFTMAPGTAFGMKRGIWTNGGDLVGSTVGEMLENMCKQMNDQAKELIKNRKNAKPNTYTFSYIGDSAGTGDDNKKKGPIFQSLMVSESEISKAKLITSTAKYGEANDVLSPKYKHDFNTKLNIPAGTPILQAFEMIISRSTYIESAFRQILTSANQPDSKNKNKDETIPQESEAKIKWYNVSAQVTNGTFDEQAQDWVWDTNYVFQVYETPFIENAYSNLGIAYYGPHKKYSFLFGGKNTEIISYSQKLDNAFYNVVVGGVPDNDNNTNAAGGTPAAQGQKQNSATTGLNNKQDQNKLAYLTNLTDPGSLATANLRILGDPDFLMSDSSSNANAIYNKFYGVDGLTVNANGGQVFIEIDFKEAQDYGYKTDNGSDYKPSNDGLLSLNDRIQFFQYNPDIVKAGVTGVSYMVGKVKSTFNQGKFEQDLSLYINTFPGYKPPQPRNESDRSGGGRRGRGGSSGTTSDQAAAPAGSSTNQGVVPTAPPKQTDVAPAGTASAPPNTNNQTMAPTKNPLNSMVVDDDALSKSTMGDTNELLTGVRTPDIYSTQGRF